MDAEEYKHNRELINTLTRCKRIPEEQQAQFGSSVNSAISMEIDKLASQIKQLEDLVAASNQRESRQVQTKSPETRSSG